MFSPTTFPCTAWYVTGGLNVHLVEIQGPSGMITMSGWFLCDSPRMMHLDELFLTRPEAIAEAERKLAVMEARHTMACLRIERRRKAVERLKGSAA